MKKNIYLYPLWLRIWHSINAVLFLFLIISGLSLQFSGTTSFLLDFETAIKTHNICGVVLTITYLFFLIVNFISGNYKFYFPKLDGIGKKIVLQIRYYVWGNFQGEKNPFPSSEEHKFNPLQQITYMIIMYVAMPIVILTGLGLLFPEIFIENYFDETGLLITVVIHSFTGLILLLFLIGHIYLGTTGTRMTENFKAIITGWEEIEEDEPNNK